MNDGASRKIIALYELLKQRRVPQATVKTVPYIGQALAELLFGGELTSILEKFREENSAIRSDIIQRIDRILEKVGSVRGPIVVFGSGNTERVLLLNGEYSLGSKNFVDSSELVGGGGVNVSIRLLSANQDVFPVLSIGKDRVGEIIKDNMKMASRSGDISQFVRDFIDSSEFLVDGFTTPYATIIVHETKRTILSERPDNYSLLPYFFEKRISDIDNITGGMPGCVIIGHLRTAEKDGKLDIDNDITSIIVNHYAGKVPIFINFGKSQIVKGYEYWRDIISKAFCLQFNIDEAREFLRFAIPKQKFVDIVDFFRVNSITAQVTVDRYGAVGNYKSGRDGVVFAWPAIEDEDEIVDPTGAGDAFAAGFVSSMQESNGTGFPEYISAIGRGRLWAAYACTTFGGSANSPNLAMLEKFSAERDANFDPRSASFRSVEIMEWRRAEQILRLIDLANR